MMKRLMMAGLLSALVLGAGVFPAPVEAAASQGEEKAAQAEAVQYVSREYGYSIVCPKKPNVIPAQALFEDKKGEILIFENEEYNIKHAWVILVDAFQDKGVPDLNKITEKEAEDLLVKLQKSNGYEGIALVNISPTNKAIYAVTAKEVEIDTTGDGVPDTRATADTQMAVTFFRGAKGGRYSIQLIDNPVLRETSLKDFQTAITTFRETGEHTDAKGNKK